MVPYYYFSLSISFFVLFHFFFLLSLSVCCEISDGDTTAVCPWFKRSMLVFSCACVSLSVIVNVCLCVCVLRVLDSVWLYVCVCVLGQAYGLG